MAGDWKKSNGLMIILVVVIAFGVFKFATREGGSNTMGDIKDTYICTECGASKEINPVDFQEEGYPPYECDSCGAKAMWKAYDCHKCKDEDGNDLVFPGTTTVEPPAAVPDEDATPEEIAQYNSERQRYISSLNGARCPKCGASAGGGILVTPHYGPEASAERARQEAEFKRRSKK